jgi:hypothetical protein
MDQYFNDHLATLLLWYALGEFILKRIFVPSTKFNDWYRKGMPQLLLLASLMVGSLGFLNVGYIVGFVMILIAAVLFEFIPHASTSILEWWLFRQAVSFGILFFTCRIAEPQNLHPFYITVEQILIPRHYAQWIYARYVRICLIIAAYAFVIGGGAQIVKGILQKFPNIVPRGVKERNEKNMKGSNTGEWIGILERLVTLTFVLAGSYEAVAFALTAKSLVRFPQLEEDKAFAEYYLVGTSTSVGIALLVGVVVRQITIG